MKTRTLFLTLLAFGIGFTGLIEAQRGGRRWGGKQDRPQMTEEQKAQFMARCEQMQQDGKFRGRRGGRGGLFGALELTDAQKEEFKALREQNRAEMQKFRDSGERPTQEQMEQIRQAHRRVFESILSDEQRAKLEELRANRPRRDGSGAAETVETESASTIAPQDETPTSVKAESWGKIKKDSAK